MRGPPIVAVAVAPLGVGLLVGAILATGAGVPSVSDPRPVMGRRAVPAAPDGPLSGLVVYVSAGHGWLLHRVGHDGAPRSWGRQRDPRFGMVEDDWTAAFVADALAPALEDAGAVVLALRERDRNPIAVEADDSGPAFREFGSAGLRSDAATQGGSARVLAPGGSATWTLEVPADGQWHAYARWSASPDQDDRATYTVTLGDEVREVVVDQRVHGGHWWPLGDACLPAGAEVSVTLTGSGEAPLSADAVRLGGGTFRIVLPWSFEVRERPFFEVAMPHQVERLGGLPAEEYACGNPVSDMRLRPHVASRIAPPGEEGVYLSIHTNATPFGSAQGLTVFYGIDRDPPTAADPESVRLASLLERAVHAHVAANDPEYRTRGVLPGDYSEVSPVHNRLPAALLEMGFHTDRDDARRMQTASFQRDAAAGVVDGLAAWRSGAPPTVDPPPAPAAPPEAFVVLE